MEKVSYYRWVDSGLFEWYGRFHESTLKPTFIRSDAVMQSMSNIEVIEKGQYVAPPETK
jgi:hypothetical protein